MSSTLYMFECLPRQNCIPCTLWQCKIQINPIVWYKSALMWCIIGSIYPRYNPRLVILRCKTTKFQQAAFLKTDFNSGRFLGSQKVFIQDQDCVDQVQRNLESNLICLGLLVTACSSDRWKIIFQFQASIESMQSGDSRMCYLTSSEVRTFHFLFYCLCSLANSQEMNILGILKWCCDRKVRESICNLEQESSRKGKQKVGLSRFSPRDIQEDVSEPYYFIQPSEII